MDASLLISCYAILLQFYSSATVVWIWIQVVYATLGSGLDLVAAYAHLDELCNNGLSTAL